MTDTVVVDKPARKRRATAKAKKPETCRKTLVTAVAALLIAVVDLFATVKMGIKLF